MPFDFSCLKQPCPSSSPLSKELDLHGFWIYHFSIISIVCLTPLLPSMLENQVGKNGVGASQSPALHPCTVSVPWILFFLGYSWCEDNLHILLYYLELGPHFGGRGEEKPSKPTVILYFVMMLWRLSLKLFLKQQSLVLIRACVRVTFH